MNLRTEKALEEAKFADNGYIIFKKDGNHVIVFRKGEVQLSRTTREQIIGKRYPRRPRK